MQNIPRYQWINLAVVDFEGEAMRWYRWLTRIRPILEWDEFLDEVIIRFGDTSFTNYEVELKNLRQRGKEN